MPLDEPLKDFIPEFSGIDKNYVTIRHLLTHSAGLVPFDSFPITYSSDQIISEIINMPLISKPGNEYHYSDFGPILLKNIFEIISNKTFDKLTDSYIFKPWEVFFPINKRTLLEPISIVLRKFDFMFIIIKMFFI